MVNRIKQIKQILEDKKGDKVSSFDFRNTDYFADGVVVCNSLNARHASSLINEMKTSLKPQEEFLNIDDKSDTWIIADLGDIIVHLIDPEVRDMYQLDDFFTTTLEKSTKYT